MPNLNGTGPMGQGPMTGRGLGDCDGATRRFGFGRARSGRRFGFGIGRFWDSNQAQSVDELKAIENQMVADLEDIRKEISDRKN